MNITPQMEISGKVLIFSIFFFTGSMSILSQTIIVRELFSVINGTEVIFGFCFFFWMLGVMSGAFSGRSIRSHEENVLVVSLFSLGLLSVCSIAGIRLSAGILYRTYNIPMLKIMIFAWFFVFPISFFSGLSFPSASLLLKNYDMSWTDRASISSVYIYESIGALFGGLIFTFFLVTHFNAFSVLTLNSLILFIILIIFFGNNTHKYPVIFIGTIVFLSAFLVSQSIDNLTEKIKWQQINVSNFVKSGNTPYCHFGVLKTSEQYSLFLNGTLSDTFPDREKDLTESIQIVCQGLMPETILILGNGYTGLAQTLSEFQFKEIDLVIEDNVLFENVLSILPQSMLLNLKSEKIKIIHSGIKPFVKKQQHNKHYDVVVYAIPEPDTLALNSYYTTEFFSQLKQIMKPEGILVLKTVHTQNYMKGHTGKYVSHLLSLLKKEFGRVALSPGNHFLIFSGNPLSSLTENPDTLKNRFVEFNLKPLYLSKMFYSEYPAHTILQIHSFLDHLENLTINTNDRPVLTQLLTIIEGFYHSEKTGQFFECLLSVSRETLAFMVMIPFIIIVVIKLLIKILLKKSSLNRGRLMVFSIGSSGLITEIVIICLFQFHFGFTYKFIGLISALFMAGLPAGAYMLSFKPPSKRIILMLYFLYIFNIFFIMLVHRTPIPSNMLLICLLFLTLTTGILTGTFFPVSLSLYSKGWSHTAKTAGVIDTLDHAGGAVGALFTALFLSSFGFTLSLGVVIIILSTSLIFSVTDSI